MKCPICNYEGNTKHIEDHLFEYHGWSIQEIEDWFEFGTISHTEEAGGL